MKKILILALISCLSIAMISAQPKHRGSKRKGEPTPEMREKMDAYRVAFITEKLDLTAAEAQEFWPIFNEREKRIHALKKERRKNKKDSDFDKLTDTEIQAMIDSHFDFKQQELDTEREYAAKFAKALPMQKVIMLHHVEHEFRRKILKEYRRRQ